MKFPVSQAHSRRWILSLLAALAFTSADAKVFTYPDLNCRCTIPDTWTYRSRNGYLLNVTNFDNKKIFSLKAYQRNLTRKQIEFIEKWVTDILISNGYTIQSRQSVPLHDATFYRFDAVKDMGNKSYHLNTYVGVFKGLIYIMEAGLYDSHDPAADEELNTMVASLNFIRPLAPAPETSSDCILPYLPAPSKTPTGESD